MRAFNDIYTIAVTRKGSPESVKYQVHGPKPPAEIAQIPEADWLAAFSGAIFSTGLNWRVVENKWPGILEAYRGFDVNACAMMDDGWFDELMSDPRIIRNGAKVTSVRDNAVFLQSLRAQGGAGQVFGEWPATDFIGLLALMKKHGARIGGTTGQYALRKMGVDSFILSKDVVARLIAEGVIDKPPTSKKAMAAVQEAFNTWMAQSGRSLTEVCRVLALSV
ncbi:DNA-3-methyladenine glycosylase I [Fluviibacterium sp. S390]|uniref:DNA-3-methyladenine glycosylase I n=1 Tax=Fluviibacterium sp. S390 TaxID=3415139 RepID=UPI003C7CA61A